VKAKYLPKKEHFVSCSIVSVILLIVVLSVYDDILEFVLLCSKYAFFLLSAHLCYVLYWKRKARINCDMKETFIIYFILFPLFVVNTPICGLVTTTQEEFYMEGTVVFVVYFLARYLKIMRNISESEKLLKNTKYHIGPGLAQANYRFLENVIKGKKTAGHVQLMKEYKHREELPADPTDWFCPKVLILFPEWKKENRERIWGSVSDILKKEKENDSKHRLSNEKITYTFKASGGNNRKCELEVLKNQDEDGNWYAIFAENRPLNTLYRMVGEPVIPFSEEDFNRQFHIYMDTLKNILDNDEGCKNKYEIFHYKDSGRLNFSKEIIRQMKTIRKESGEQHSTIEIQSNGKSETQGQTFQKDATMPIQLYDRIETDMANEANIRQAIQDVEKDGTILETSVDNKKNK